MEMSMSGVKIGLIEIIILKALRTHLWVRHQAWLKYHGVVTGEARTGIADAHHAASAHRTVAVTV
jgi:hypothetical protein